jgi:predicted ester cyclase
MGAEFINNDPTPVAARDRESMKHFIETFTKTFPDHHHAIEDLIAEVDKVVMRCTLTATHKGQFPGFLEMPPTGKSICQRQIHILRVQDGKLVEHWVVRDDLAMMQQLGLIPTPELTGDEQSLFVEQETPSAKFFKVPSFRTV